MPEGSLKVHADLLQDANKAGDDILIGFGVPGSHFLQCTQGSAHHRRILQVNDIDRSS